MCLCKQLSSRSKRNGNVRRLGREDTQRYKWRKREGMKEEEDKMYFTQILENAYRGQYLKLQSKF